MVLNQSKNLLKRLWQKSVKPKYALLKFRNLDGLFVIRRNSGGYISGGMTITKYDVLYPENIDQKTRRTLNFNIKGDGRSTKGTIFKKDKFHNDIRYIIKDLFER